MNTRRGDHVYFQAVDGPRSGAVLAVGEHGCTVDCGGARQQVRWRCLLGYKRRMQPAMTIVDQGEDGAIVEDEDGARTYVRGQLPAVIEARERARSEEAVQASNHADPRTEAEQYARPALLNKALTMPERIVFLKSGSIKNRPGLSLQDVTDKHGRQSKRWVRANKDEGKSGPGGHEEDGGSVAGAGKGYGTHDIAIGDTVKFETGDGLSEGKVVATGKDGATLEGPAGNRHQVLWSNVANISDARASEGGSGQSNAGRDDTGGDSHSGYGWIDPDEFSAAAIYAQHNDPDATAQSIMADFPDGTEAKMEAAVERLASIESTDQRLQRDDGSYPPERHHLHEEIIASFLNEESVKAALPAEGDKPTLTLLGGRGGSGKSQFAGKVYDASRAIVIDPDEVKKGFAGHGYEGWNAMEFHEESSFVTKEVIRRAKKSGANIVIDKTLNSLSVQKSIGDFRDHGYRTEVHYMFLPRQKAASRAVNRFLGRDGRGKGRLVPPGVVLSNTDNEANFDILRKQADAWSFYSNDVVRGNDPVLVSSSRGKKDGKEDDKQALGKQAGSEIRKAQPAPVRRQLRHGRPAPRGRPAVRGQHAGVAAQDHRESRGRAPVLKSDHVRTLLFSAPAKPRQSWARRLTRTITRRR